MRFKRRYFSVEIMPQNELTKTNISLMNKLKHTDVSDTIHKSIEKLYGDYGMAVMMPSFSVIYYNSSTNLCILRTARDLQKKFNSLLTFTNKLGELNVYFKVIHVSGSIKKSKEHLAVHCQKENLNLYDKISKEKIGIKDIELMPLDNIV